MKKLFLIAAALLVIGSTSTRNREKRTIDIASKQLGISADSLVKKVTELEALATQLKQVE